MADTDEPDITPADPAIENPAAEQFYSGALERIRRFMLVIGGVATVAAWVALGWRFAIGVLVGGAIAWVNFFWLKQAVSALADKVTRTGQRQSSSGVVAKFLLRYALIALAAYAIFRVSRESLYGLLGGLFLTVAAILCEAAYEGYAAIRRGV